MNGRGLIIGWFMLSSVWAQITVTTGMTPQQLVQNVLLGGGVIAFNITYNGDPAAIGYFANGLTSLNINDGIILSTGSVLDAPGPNNSQSTTTDFSTGGDPDLQTLTSFPLEDAAVLEFDFIPIGDTVLFRYVFASEEYCEWACDQFNDVFGFFISGPGIPGGKQNIAIIPGTNPPQPVTINNVNNGDCSPPSTCGGYAQYYIDNTGGLEVEYDGFTVVFTAMAVVVPCDTYHIKLAIADASDGAYDSAVFLEAKSFSSNALNLQAVTPITDTRGNKILPEGCGVAYFVFTAEDTLNQAQVIYFDIDGNATNGTDYYYIPDSIVIPAGAISDTLWIIPIEDFIPEAPETLIITITNQAGACANVTVVTDTIFISDTPPFEVFLPEEVVACGTKPVTLTPYVTPIPSPLNYLWSTGDTTSTLTIQVGKDTLITLIVSDTCGHSASDSVWIRVFPDTPRVNIIPTQLERCQGDAGTLIATEVFGGNGGVKQYLWRPTRGLSAPDTSHPIANPTQTTWYYVWVMDSVGCISLMDSVLVIVHPKPQITPLFNDTTICQGDNVQLQISISPTGSNYVYQWSPAAFLNDSTLSKPVAAPDSSIVYSVIAVDTVTGCESMPAQIAVQVTPKPIANAGPDRTLCQGDSVQLYGSADNVVGIPSFVWSPATGLNDPTSPFPKAAPTTTTTYQLIVYNGNCPSDPDSVTIYVQTPPTLLKLLSEPVWVCPGESKQLLIQLVGTGNYTFSWSPATGLSDPTVLQPFATTDSVTIFYLTISSDSCVFEDVLSYEVRKVEVPSVVDADTTDLGVTYCLGDPNGVVLPAKVVGSYTNLYWSPTTGLSNPSVVNPVATPNQSTLYVLTVETQGCKQQDSVWVRVLPPPPLTLNKNTAYACVGDTLTLVAQGGYGNPVIVWEWKGNQSQANPLQLPIEEQDTFYVYVTLHEGSSFCAGRDSVLVHAGQRPSSQITVDYPRCSTMPVRLRANSDISPVQYVWDMGDGNVATFQDSSYVYSRAGSYTITLVTIPTTATHCADTQSYTLTIFPAVKANFYTEPAITSQGTIIYLPETEIAFVDSSLGMPTWWLWDFGDGTQSQEPNPIHRYEEPGQYEVTLWVMNDGKCRDSITKAFFEVVIPEVPPIPTVFTPNGDGINDLFSVNYEGAQDFQLVITDRWGRKVFETNAPQKGWDGRLPNGNPAPEGVYFYICKIGKQILRGNLTLIR